MVFAPGLEGAFVYDDLRLVARAPASQSIGAAFDRFLEPLYAFEDPGADVQRGLGARSLQRRSRSAAPSAAGSPSPTT